MQQPFILFKKNLKNNQFKGEHLLEEFQVRQDMWREMGKEHCACVLLQTFFSERTMGFTLVVLPSYTRTTQLMASNCCKGSAIKMINYSQYQKATTKLISNATETKIHK